MSLYQTRDPSNLNSKQKHVSKTSRKNFSRKFKIEANHTEIIVPGSKINNEISKLKTNTEDHHCISETGLCVTFSEPAASKHSVSSAVTGTMFKEFNSSKPGDFYTTGRKRIKRKGRSKKLVRADSYSGFILGQNSPLEF